MNIKVIFYLFTTGILLHAEDWTTTDGHTYKDVKVVKVEADAVTILDSDGGALVPLDKLAPELQSRFNYDPAKAKVAAKSRDEAAAANNTALAAEAAAISAQRQQEAAQQQRTREEAAKKAAVAHQQEELIESAKVCKVQVIQVLPDGFIADVLASHIDPATEVAGISKNSDGTWRHVDTGTTVYTLSGNTIYVQGGPQGLADGDRIDVTAARDGTFQYTDTQGATCTVPKWVVVNLGSERETATANSFHPGSMQNSGIGNR